MASTDAIEPGAVKVTLPECKDCGGGNVHVFPRDGEDATYGNVWLCSSCRYKRVYPHRFNWPDTEELRKRVAPLQEETLF